MEKKTTILDMLTQLAYSINHDVLLADLLNSQPEEIKLAIKSKDINQLKSCITNKSFFANETRVTTY